jgi:hypothetical protein
MKTKFWLSALFIFFCINVAGSIKGVFAQSGCKCLENSTAQTPCARNGAAKPTAQELMARREIQERIDQTIEADEAKDVDAATHFDTADFTVKNLDGSVATLADVKKGIKEGYDYLYAVSDKTHINIDCLVLNGKEATVYINQHFVRTLPDRKDGSPHEAITNVTHRETWIYTEQGWMRKAIVELQQGPSFLDGQPFNPN